MKIKNLIITGLLLAIPQATNAAQMALSPGGGELISGCQHRINIVVNTEGVDSRAADAFLRYNPDEIEIIDQIPNIGGIQLKPGAVYESYPGNQVNNGVIRLTAFNRIGFFNGRGNLASFTIKGKPEIEKTSISFDYAPGRSTDSNVANDQSVDVLNGAYGATYTFKKGKCGNDKTPPKIIKIHPADNAMLAPVDSDINFIITDENSGVNIDQIEVEINGQTYTKADEEFFSFKGSPSEYKVTINPKDDFEPYKPINIKIQAQDNDGNAVKEAIYVFNKLMPVEACKVLLGESEIEVIDPSYVEQLMPVNLRPAAPNLFFGGFKISFLILFIISLILNIWLIMRKHHFKFDGQFTKKQISNKRVKSKR